MPHIKEYIALRARLTEIDKELAALEAEKDQVKEKLWDIENFDLTDADLAKIGECDRLGVDP